jgi:hypothetical protein
LVMNTDEELKIQAENANDLHVVCSYLEITWQNLYLYLQKILKKLNHLF